MDNYVFNVTVLYMYVTIILCTYCAVMEYLPSRITICGTKSVYTTVDCAGGARFLIGRTTLLTYILPTSYVHLW